MTIEYIMKSAIRAYRTKGTLIAWAFLKALGIAATPPMPEDGTMVSEGRYTELMECFENHGSPMDGRT